MGRKKKEVKSIEEETPKRKVLGKSSIPDETMFDNTQTLYEYSLGKSSRIDYNPYDYGFDFGSINLEDF